MRYPIDQRMFFSIILLALALIWPFAIVDAAPTLPFAPLTRQTAHDGAANDDYGSAVAASSNTLVTGAPLHKVGNNARQGAVYVYVKSGAAWVFQQQLTADDGAAGDRFGYSVALSGETIVVGAPSDQLGTNSVQGSAYVFTRSNGVWSFQKKLTAPDGAASDQFGSAVAISGGTLVAGAFADDIGTKADQGSAYVFVRSNGVWSFQQKLTANDGEANDQFGASVAISGGTIVAGALLDDIGTVKDAGSAYVFTRSGTVWAQQQKLLLSGLGFIASGDLFGAAVALSGETILIGAPFARPFGRSQGMVNVFVRSGGVWSYQTILYVNDGAVDDRFGSSVALNGETAVIGAHFDDIGTAESVNQDQGSAYLFTRNGTLWGARQKFTAQFGAARELFGQAVALSGETAIIGAPHAKVGDNAAQGALYLYGCGYLEQPQITGLGGQNSNRFGDAVALDGDTAVVGAPDARVGTNVFQGTVYVYTREGGNWRQVTQLFAPNAQARDRFGYSVAVSGDTIVVGAPGYNLSGCASCGAAFFYFRSGGNWTLATQFFGFSPDSGLGRAVAAGGDLIAVGAPFHDVSNNQDAGAVYLFRRNGAALNSEGRLTANDGAAQDFFGWSAAVADGRVLVGARGPNEGERSKGAAYLFEHSPTSTPAWRQLPKLLADDGEPTDHFGESVALSGNTALIGAPGKSDKPPLRVKVAYVFSAPETAEGNWSQQARLPLSGGSPAASLAVALSGNTAVIGSSVEPVNSAHLGSARVFTRNGAVWALQQQLFASDDKFGYRFGTTVAFSGDTILVGAPGAGNISQGAVYPLKMNCAAALARLTSVSAASFATDSNLAPEAIVAGFGANLANATQSAATLPLPTQLAGVSLKVKDSAGVERLAPLFFVSPGQINYQIPPGTAPGAATITVTNAAGSVATGAAQIAAVAPGLFSSDASGQGVAAALVLRVKANGAQNYEPVAQYDAAQQRFVPAPIDLGPATDRVFLVLFGTGLRFRDSLAAVSCTIGVAPCETTFAGATPGLVGFDQVNLRLPRTLAGSGEVDVALFIDGEATNTVRVNVR